MTLSDFFLKQTLKEIRVKFKEVGLDKYYNIPEDINGFCKMFSLKKDKLCTRIYVIKRFSGAEIYVDFSLPNPQFPECPIEFDSEFYSKSQKNACSVSLTRALDSYEAKEIFVKVSDIFDNRPDYNNIEYRVRLEYLPGLYESYKDYQGVTNYQLKEGKTLWELYEAVCEHINSVAPLIRMFVNSVEDGSWDKMWNKLMPRNKWRKGDEINHAMFFPVIMAHWHRAVKAGIEPKIEDFVKYFAAVNVCEIGYKQNYEDKNPLTSWDSDDNAAADRFKWVLSEFDKNYIEDNSIDKWNDVYSDANKELIKEVKLVKKRLSEKYNINEKYLECYLKLADNPYIKEICWNKTEVPKDAYLTAK